MKSLFLTTSLLLLTLPLIAQNAAPTNGAGLIRRDRGTAYATNSAIVRRAEAPLKVTNNTPMTNAVVSVDKETNSPAAPESAAHALDSTDQGTNGEPQNAETNRPAPTNAQGQLEYSAFKIIYEHNIFDASRMGGTYAGPRHRAKVSKVDYFKLLGTMRYEKGRFAFFDGNDADFHKTLQITQNIAEYKILEIGYDSVKLAPTNGAPFELKVGMQMKRVDAGPWSEAAASESFAPPPTSSSSSETVSKSNDAPSSSNASENEVMKRLMQKRQQELSK